MRRYLRLLAIQLRTSLLMAVQYRWAFLSDGVLALLWASTAIIPIFAVYAPGRANGLPGWSFAECLVVTGWFIILESVLEGAINPSLQSVVTHIRQGTMDLVLLKPADAQFLVSTTRFNPWRVVGFVAGLGVIAAAFMRLGRVPSFGAVLLAIALFICALAVLYALWILIVAAAFRVVKIDNLAHFLSAIIDAGRWPATVFRGAVRVVLTIIIPVALMTTYPAEALLQRYEHSALPIAVLGSVAFSVLARWVWLNALKHYTSAGG